MAKNQCLQIRIRRKNFVAGSAVFLLLALTLSLSSQILLTGSTPSPSGVYAGLVSTGGQSPDPVRDTILARDRGNVGIRLGMGTAPAAPLDIGPRDNGNAGAQVLLRGAGANPYLYLDNYAGDLRMVSQDPGGESEKFRIANGGNATFWGNRIYLLRALGAGDRYWIMAGGSQEGVDNALGFDPAAKIIGPGPGWTLTAGARVAQGTFYPTCPYACDGTNGPPYVKSTTIFTNFTPDAASCSPGAYFDDSVVAAFAQLDCLNDWITLGPNYVTFTSVTAGAPANVTSDPGKINVNYLIVGH